MKMLTRFNHHHHRGAAKKATTTLLFSRKFVFKSGDKDDDDGFSCDDDDDDDVYESFSLDDPRVTFWMMIRCSGNFFIGHHEKNGRGLYASRDVTKNESIFKKKKKKKNERTTTIRREEGQRGGKNQSRVIRRFGITIWSVTCAWESSQRRRRTTTQ